MIAPSPARPQSAGDGITHKKNQTRMPKKKLTFKFVEAATTGGKNRIDYTDEKARGLVFRITKSGTKTFSYRFSFKGSDRRLTIGEYPAISLGDARAEALRLRGMVDQGKDPQYEKLIDRKKEIPPTVKELAETFIRVHVKQLKASTQKSYQHRINKIIVPEFGDYQLQDLQRMHIVEFLEEMVFQDGQHVNANRVRAIFSSMISFAVDRGLLEINIVKNVRPVGKEKSRERVLSDDEIKTLWAAINEQVEPGRSVLQFLLLTGQRLGETLKMQWQHMDKNIWIIPAIDTKKDRLHAVPLNPMAMQIIQDLKPLTGESQWVFESFFYPGNPARNINHIVNNIRDLSGVPDFRIHDLRRTAATNMARMGTDRTVLGKVINHKGMAGDSAVTAVYDRYAYMDEKRLALLKWERHLQAVITGEAPANIIKMRG